MSQSFGVYSSGQLIPLGGDSVTAQYVSLVAIAGFISSGLILPIATGQQGCGDVSMVTYNHITGQLNWTGTNSGSYTIGTSNLAAMADLYNRAGTTYDPQIIIDAVNQIVSSAHGIEVQYLEQLVDATTLINTLVGADTATIAGTINGRYEELSNQLDSQFEGYAEEIKTSSTANSASVLSALAGIDFSSKELTIINAVDAYGQTILKSLFGLKKIGARRQLLREIDTVAAGVSFQATQAIGVFDDVSLTQPTKIADLAISITD